MLTLAWWAPAPALGDTESDEITTTVVTSRSTTDVGAAATVDAEAVTDPPPAEPAAPEPSPGDAGTNAPVPGPTAPPPDGTAVPGAKQPSGNATPAPAPKTPNPPGNAKAAPASKNQSPAGNASPAPTSKDDSAAGNATPAPATKDQSSAGAGATQAPSSDRLATRAPAPTPTPTDAESAPPPAPSTPVALPPVPRSVIVAHQLDGPSAPRAAPALHGPAVVAGPRESARPAVELAAIRPTTTHLLSSPPPLLAPPEISPTPSSTSGREAAGRARVHKSKPPQASHEDPRRAPVLPSGPPTRDPVASSATAPGGAAAAGMWSAILVAFLLYAARELRRNRAPLLLAGPAGVPSPQQRPG